MTERYEITSILQRALVSEPSVLCSIVKGDRERPAVFMESVHQIMKLVAGAPNLRPAWFFDVEEQGEGLSDVGTHLIDLVQWSLFPDQPIDYRKDIEVLAGKRWPTPISREQFRRVTGEADFPPYLASQVIDGSFPYYCNNSVAYTIRGVHADVRALWGFDDRAAAPDTYVAVFRGTTSRVEVRQGAPEKFRPEIYVVPNRPELKARVSAALTAKLQALAEKLPGLGVDDRGGEFRVVIPERLRVGHEEHFAQVTHEFLSYYKHPPTLPSWEAAGMAAKYYVTTRGVELAKQTSR
jgi:predicted dehydrogenase